MGAFIGASPNARSMQEGHSHLLINMRFDKKKNTMRKEKPRLRK
jgi:hypothetical protein